MTEMTQSERAWVSALSSLKYSLLNPEILKDKTQSAEFPKPLILKILKDSSCADNRFKQS